MAREDVPAFDPPADVLVDDTHVVIHLDLPGVDVDDVEATLSGHTLTVRGRRTYPYEGVEAHALRSIERGFGPFERRLSVPAGLDPATVDATLIDGVLTLRLPRGSSRDRHQRVSDTEGAAPR